MSAAATGGGTDAGAAEPELGEGAGLGRYVVERKVGAGGMGVVYAARDPALDRRVALKLLRESGTGDSGEVHRARLQREAQVMARLSHENVIAVYDVGVHEGRVFAAMELIEGTTLRAWTAERRHGWRETLAMFRSAARGLAAAHEAGVVHRDFKPDNVLIRRDGRVVVTDFGLARTVRDAREDTGGGDGGAGGAPMITWSGALVGTPAYMSPEQFRGHVADARSDQFSFCVALYEALFGERPFATAGSAATAGQDLPEHEALALEVLGGRVRPVPAGASVPSWLRRLLLKGLAVDPAERYPSMDALVADLERHLRPRRWLWIAVAATALAIAVTGVVVLARVPRREPAAPAAATPDPAPRAVREKQLTRFSEERLLQGAAISPDGRLLAYTVRPDEVVVSNLATGEERRAPLPPDAVIGQHDIEWFPGGDRLIVEYTRGEVERLASWSLASNAWTDLGGGFDGKVAPDGRRLAYVATEEEVAVVRVASATPGLPDGATVVRVTEHQVLSVAWSPSGERIAYLWIDNERFGVDTVALDGRPPVPVASASSAGLGNQHLLWAPDGRLIYDDMDGRKPVLRAFTVDPDGVARPAPVALPWADDPQHGYVISISATSDGRFALLRVDTSAQVYHAVLQDDGLGPLHRLSQSDALNVDPSWTADSTAVLFSSTRFGDAYDVYRQAPGERDAALVVRTPAEDRKPVAWRGGALFLTRERGSLPATMMFAPAGGGPPRLVPGGPFDDYSCNARGDCVIGTMRADTLEVRRFDPETGTAGPVVASRDVVFASLALSPDGRRVALLGQETATVSIVDLQSGASRDLTVVDDVTTSDSTASWSADGSALFAAFGTPGGRFLARVSLDGDVRILRESRNHIISDPSVSPDGRHLAFTELRFKGDVWLVDQL